MTRTLDVELVGGSLDGRLVSVPIECPCPQPCVPDVIEYVRGDLAGVHTLTRFERVGPPRERPAGGVVWRFELTGGAGHGSDR